MSKAGEFIMTCFHARTNAHVLHLKTKSYAQHMALNDFYDAIVGFADSLAEIYIGEYGMIESYPGKFTPASNPRAFIRDFIKYVEDTRMDVCDDSQCQNTIDEILALAYSTKYKLEVLS